MKGFIGGLTIKQALSSVILIPKLYLFLILLIDQSALQLIRTTESWILKAKLY